MFIGSGSRCQVNVDKAEMNCQSFVDAMKAKDPRRFQIASRIEVAMSQRAFFGFRAPPWELKSPSCPSPNPVDLQCRRPRPPGE